MKNYKMACVSLLILMSIVEVAHQLEIRASYTTSFRCSDNTYALIAGDNLTLKYEYGYNYTNLQSSHLYELFKARHMFDYEQLAGKAFLKDRYKRLASYTWTDKGIKLTIVAIDKKVDLGKYEGEVETEQEYNKKIIEVKQIFDPPSKVNLTTPNGTEGVNLTTGFGEYTFEASAESDINIICNSIMIKWMSSTSGKVRSCQTEDESNATTCQLILKESEMKVGDCLTLEVYAEHYGVQSEKKSYKVCYYAENLNVQVITGVAAGVVILMIISAIVLIVWMKRRGQQTESEKVKYSEANQAVYL